jgi:WD40 repeat protein
MALLPEVWRRGDLRRMEEDLDEHVPRSEDEVDWRGFEWYYLRYFCRDEHHPLKCGAPVNAVAVHPDGRTIASGDTTGLVRLWDVPKGEHLRKFQAHQGPISALAFSPDGKAIATAGDEKVDDGTTPRVKLWPLRLGEKERSCPGHGKIVWAVAFDPHGDTLAYASADGTVRVWEIATSQEIQSLHHPGGVEATAVAFSPDGKTLATGTTHDGNLQGTVQLWERKGAGSWGRAAIWTDAGCVHCLAFGADSKVLFSGSGNPRATSNEGRSEGRQWEFPSGKPVRLGGHAAPVTFLAVAGRTLVSGSEDGTVRRWDLASPVESGMFGGHTGAIRGVALTPSGLRLLMSTSRIDAPVRRNSSVGRKVLTSSLLIRKNWGTPVGPEGVSALELAEMSYVPKITLIGPARRGETATTVRARDVNAATLERSRCFMGPRQRGVAGRTGDALRLERQSVIAKGVALGRGR